MTTRLRLRAMGEEKEDMIVFSFWPDVIMIKEIGDPMAVARHLKLDRKELGARVIMAQGRQNTNYAIDLYACHPFFIQGFASMTNGENTAFVPIRTFLESRGFPGYVGYNSDSEVFTHILHYAHRTLGFGIEAYKHVITPLQDEDIDQHPDAHFLRILKQTCRPLIIDGPNCVIGCLPEGRTLILWAVILLSIPLLLNTAATGLVQLGRSMPENAQQIDLGFARAEAGYAADIARAYRVYSKGTFMERITARRVYDYFNMGLPGFVMMGSNIMAMFLIGMYFGKRQVFQNLEGNQRLFRNLLIWGLGIGLLGNAVYASLIMPLSRVEQTLPLLIATASQGIGAPLLCLAYVSTLCLLYLSPRWGQALNVLAPVGQMALSNYLLQSITCTMIFYSYGLGLFGKVGSALGILLTIAIFLVQIPISHWWMKRFKYGPAEWLWRSLTYLRWQPINRPG